MRLKSPGRRLAATSLAITTAAALSLAACGSGDDDASGSSSTVASDGPCGTKDNVTLTVGLFGTFGFKENGMWDAYKKVCPNVTVQEDVVEQSADYWTKLKTRLASGSGLDDIQAIEIGFVADVVKNQSTKFVNWNTVPNAAKDKAEFYDWKWKQASSADGKVTVGLGTDTGPQAICYRKDLFEKAGLPTDRDQVAAKMATWDDFINLGKQYEASSSKPSGSHFIDSVSSIFSAAVYQGDVAYANPDGTSAVDTSDGVKTAWKYATDAASAKISAGLSQWTPAWNKAFSSGTFATIACPTWMMGYIQGQAGDAYKGKWDIAPALPGGAANWGGSWLGVPEKAKNKAAAIALVEWLSAKDQQVTMWTSAKQGGHFPSNQEAAADPSVANATSAYFDNAPVGQIFGKIAGELKIPPIGTNDTPIQSAFTTQLTNVETKGTSSDAAFQAALKQVKQITG